ncbi:Conserved_hypothetical protein [Hexamita inflata]|uniref:Uncharacterized protein n=1 Tax=Hexamita inflata TaxID=28002 RepID=A0AA86RCI9_9EUKA|nr:Conserved hypothetical protein [Hexamita inflata]
MFSAQIGFNKNILEKTGSTKDYYAPWKYTFSKLGSFDDQYNPKYYLLFSACLWSLIAFDIPMTFFIYRRNQLISKFGASISQIFYIIGWIGIILDGCFCTSTKLIKGTQIQYISVHIKVSSAGAIGFALALLNNGVLMFIDQNNIGCIKNSGKKQFKCAKQIIIVAIIMSVILISAAITQSIDTTGQKQWIQYLLGFELWENIIIFAIITSLLWNAMILPIDIQNINLSKQTKE